MDVIGSNTASGKHDKQLEIEEKLQLEQIISQLLQTVEFNPNTGEEHVKPLSTKQLLLHPSASRRFPSSHSSPGVRIPSPQLST